MNETTFKTNVTIIKFELNWNHQNPKNLKPKISLK
jgi:hypothetical protein